MKVQELIDLVNNGEFEALCHVEYKLPNDVKKVENNLNEDRYCWFFISTSVYECEDGFVGITGPSQLLSESMTWSDIDYGGCYAEEYEEVQTITYKPKQ